MDPGQIGSTISNTIDVNWLSAVGQIFIWTGRLLVAGVILAVFYILYLIVMNKYKIEYEDLRGTDLKIKDGKIVSEKGKTYNIRSRTRKEMARAIKGKDGVIKWKLFWARRTIPPVDYQYITEKNRVSMIRTADDTFIPAIKQKTFTVGNHVLENFLPIEADIKLWQQTEAQKIAMENRPDGYMNKVLGFYLLAIILLLVFAGFVIWFSLHNVQVTVDKIDFLGEAINGLKTVGAGVGPK